MEPINVIKNKSTMTTVEKRLFLKDICARLPYGLKATTKANGWSGTYTVEGCIGDIVYLDCPIYDKGDEEWPVNQIIIFLRPMSSMTDEEKDIYDKMVMCNASWVVDDWLNSHHFDYHRLIEKGLAFEAPEGMYKSLIMEQEKSIPKIYVEQFKEKFGEKEIKLEHPVTTIEDYRADPFSSGSSGHITKVRLKGDTLEFYHSWWSYGWYSYDKLYKDYPSAVEWAINQVLS